jgi:hypothetical protein
MNDQKIEKTSRYDKKCRNLFKIQHKKLLDLKKIRILSIKEFKIHSYYLRNIIEGAKGLIKEIKKKYVKIINEDFYKKIFVRGQIGLKKLEKFNETDIFKPISEALVNFVYMVKFMNKRRGEIVNIESSNPHIFINHNEISFIKMLNEVSKLFKNSINEMRSTKCTLRTNSGLMFVNGDFFGKIYDKYLSDEIPLSNLSKSFINKNIESTLLVLTFKEEEGTTTYNKRAKRSLGDATVLQIVENQLYEESYLSHNLPLPDNNLNNLSLKDVKNVTSNVNNFYPALPTFPLISALFFWIYRFLKKLNTINSFIKNRN